MLAKINSSGRRRCTDPRCVAHSIFLIIGLFTKDEGIGTLLENVRDTHLYEFVTHNLKETKQTFRCVILTLETTRKNNLWLAV